MTLIQFFPKAEFVRILPNVPKCGLNTRHDNREVTWSDVKWHLFSFSESRICPNIYRMFLYRMFRSVDWTHDMIIVKWHLFICHERKLCALTNAPPVQSTQTSQWLSTLFQANCSAAQVYVLHPIGNSSSLQDAGDDHSWRYYNSLSAKKDILKNFLCIWWWQMLRWKHVLTKKLQKYRIWFTQLRIAYVRKRKLSEGRICRIFTECSEVWIEHTTW